VKYKDGLYFIEDEDPIAGWMEIEDNNELKPLDQLDIDAIDSRYQQPQPSGKMERCLIPYKSENSKGPWLNKDDPAENFFMKHFGEDLQRVKNSLDHLPYYKINADLLVNIGTVSNELHRMFLEATNRVIQDDQLLTRFGIPNIFWNRIRQSWTNDQNLTMTGRFDLAFNDQNLKVFEYNADSASALFECAIIQKKWAEAVDLPSKFMTGTRLHSILVNNWKKMKISTRIHLLIDNDHDEMLTALYMQRVMKEAGIESKICVMTDEFYWKDATIIDSDGQTVKFVWKLWMWETIFQDYIDASKERDLNGWKPLTGEHPRISDILLYDQVKVIEPLWKVITSNKALLPVVWSMYPNHPNLLRSEWTLTNELKETSFVKKPLVGRCGQNITLYNASDNSVIDETTGQFSSRDCIYQQLFPLKNYDGYYAILGSWIVHGNFAGFCIREDQKLITDANSPVTACCIVWD
jgi:trypanothione synthetase/amidase